MYGISEVVSMKIGMMGGTFDPIHNGHLHLAQTALTQFDLDQIWFMPNGMPPHKKQSSIESDIHERIAMTQIAIKANKQFYLQRIGKKYLIPIKRWNIFGKCIRTMNFILS